MFPFNIFQHFYEVYKRIDVTHFFEIFKSFNRKDWKS